jgi:hypothetical protein
LKKNKLKVFLSVFIIVHCIYATAQVRGDKNIENIRPFLIEIINSDYSNAYSISLVLSNESLKIVFKGGLKGEEDSILLIKKVLPSDTLRKISEINLGALKDYYSNDCIQDGSQLTIKSYKDGKQKVIQLSNYYQTDIGTIIYFVNNLVPVRYKIWYDKEKLLAGQKKCR